MQHTCLIPKLIAQRRRPHENRHDLAESPRTIVGVVLLEPLQARGKNEEAVNVYAEECQAENGSAETQHLLGVSEHSLFRRNMELFQNPIVYSSLGFIRGAAEVIDNKDN